MIAVLSDNGTLLSQQRYMPFGQVRNSIGSITQTDFGYTGQRNEAYMGLMDYRSRWYDGSLGRFIQPDSIVPGVGDSQGWNRYSYVRNSPIRFSDPDGHEAKDRCDYYGGVNCHTPSTPISIPISKGSKWSSSNVSTTSAQEVSGSLPYTQISYGTQAEESGCGNCGMEPEGSGWTTAFGLINDALIGDLNNRAAKDLNRIYVRVNFVKNPDSSIHIPSLSIENGSNGQISIMTCFFKQKIAFPVLPVSLVTILAII